MEELTLSEGYSGHTFGWRGETDLDNGLRLSVKVLNDDPSCYADNGPRDWDNLGTMVCWHSRYNLGDEQPKESPEEWWKSLAWDISTDARASLEFWEYGEGAYRADAEERIQAAIEKAIDKEIAVILSLYLYDHSGITMSTSPFSCPWDSGQVGYIYVTKETLRKEYNVKRVTKSIIAKAEKVLRGEVEVYDDHLTGNVWGYSIEATSAGTCPTCGHTAHSTEFEDSCWGFYGNPRDYLLSEVNAILAEHGVKVDF